MSFAEATNFEWRRRQLERPGQVEDRDLARHVRHVAHDLLAHHDRDDVRDGLRECAWDVRAQAEQAAVEDDDASRAHAQRVVDRDVAHHPAIHEVAAVDAHGGVDARNRRAREQRRYQRPRLEVHDAPGSEIHRRRREGQREILDALGGERARDQLAQPVGRNEVVVVPMPCAHPVHRASGEHRLAGDLHPEMAEPVGGPAGILGDQRAVDRSDRRPHHQVRAHARLRQGLQHADLDSAEAGATP